MVVLNFILLGCLAWIAAATPSGLGPLLEEIQRSGGDPVFTDFDPTDDKESIFRDTEIDGSRRQATSDANQATAHDDNQNQARLTENGLLSPLMDEINRDSNNEELTPPTDGLQERTHDEAQVDSKTGRRESTSTFHDPTQSLAENHARLQERMEMMTETIDEHTPLRLAEDDPERFDKTSWKLWERHIFEDIAHTLEKGEPLGDHITAFEPVEFYRKLAEIRAAPVSFTAFHRMAEAGAYTEGTEYRRRFEEVRRRFGEHLSTDEVLAASFENTGRRVRRLSPTYEQVKAAEDEEEQAESAEAAREGHSNADIHTDHSDDDCHEEDCSTLDEKSCKLCYKCVPEPEDGDFDICKDTSDVEDSELPETSPSPMALQETSEHEALDEMLSDIDCSADDFQNEEACESGPCIWNHPNSPDQCIPMGEENIDSNMDGFSGYGSYGVEENEEEGFGWWWYGLYPLEYFPLYAGECIHLDIFGITLKGCAGMEGGIGPCKLKFYAGASITAHWQGMSLAILISPGVSVNYSRVKVQFCKNGACGQVFLHNQCGCDLDCDLTVFKAAYKRLAAQLLDFFMNL